MFIYMADTLDKERGQAGIRPTCSMSYHCHIRCNCMFVGMSSLGSCNIKCACVRVCVLVVSVGVRLYCICACWCIHGERLRALRSMKTQ